jgi:hypothetical protein
VSLAIQLSGDLVLQDSGAWDEAPAAEAGGGGSEFQSLPPLREAWSGIWGLWSSLTQCPSLWACNTPQDESRSRAYGHPHRAMN